MFGKAFKFALVVVISIFFVTMAVDAVDHRGNFSQSVIGRLFAGESNSPCPVGMVLVDGGADDFCVDEYENSAGDKCPYLDPGNEKESNLNLNNPDCQAISSSLAIPWRNLTQIQAASLCAKAGKRLPTAEEWFAAAMGTPDKNENWGADDCQVDNNWASQPGKTGSGDSCFSYAGAYDMVGNVWEWIKGEIENGSYEDMVLPGDGYIKAVSVDGLPLETDPDNPTEIYNGDYLWLKTKGLRGVAKGGYWANGQEAGQYSFYAVTEPSFAGTGVGFRCVKDVLTR
jgi:formylglycine-generating enzyme required for sulfatase activity